VHARGPHDLAVLVGVDGEQHGIDEAVPLRRGEVAQLVDLRLVLLESEDPQLARAVAPDQDVLSVRRP
jgi:hypothetical protein